jgi:hypothetical protein
MIQARMGLVPVKNHAVQVNNGYGDDMQERLRQVQG